MLPRRSVAGWIGFLAAFVLGALGMLAFPHLLTMGSLACIATLLWGEISARTWRPTSKALLALVDALSSTCFILLAVSGLLALARYILAR